MCVCVASDSQGECALEAGGVCTNLQVIITIVIIIMVMIFITHRVPTMRWTLCQPLCPDPSIESLQQSHFTEEEWRFRGIKIPWSEVRTWVGPGTTILISRVTLVKVLNLPELYFLQQKVRLCHGVEVPHLFESVSCILMSDSLRIFTFWCFYF